MVEEGNLGRCSVLWPTVYRSLLVSPIPPYAFATPLRMRDGGRAQVSGGRK